MRNQQTVIEKPVAVNHPREVAKVVRQTAIVIALAALAGCSSSSSGTPGNNDQPENDGGDDASQPMDATTDALQSAHDGSSTSLDGAIGDAAHSADSALADTGVDGSHASDAAGAEDAGGDAAHASDAASGATVDAGDLAAGDAGAASFCSAVCTREATCLDAGADAATCTCSAGTIFLYRTDYVAQLSACESVASCQDLLTSSGAAADSGLLTCEDAALAQITPTPAVTAFCAQVGDSSCSADAITDCPDTIKVYSDTTVAALSACVSDPTCTHHTDCLTAALTPP